MNYFNKINHDIQILHHDDHYISYYFNLLGIELKQIEYSTNSHTGPHSALLGDTTTYGNILRTIEHATININADPFFEHTNIDALCNIKGKFSRIYLNNIVIGRISSINIILMDASENNYVVF